MSSCGELKNKGAEVYAIIRTEKVKNWPSLANLYRHHERLAKVENTDPERPIITLKPCAEPNLNQTVRAKIGKQTIRKNAVLAHEIFCSASPEYFREDAADHGAYDETKMRAWARAAFNYLRKTYGENLVYAVIHLDEATPHIHAMVVPLNERGKLSSSSLFTPQTCRQMQTDYAAALAHLGLKRGREGSKAKHTKVKEWYAKQAENYKLEPHQNEPLNGNHFQPTQEARA